MSSNKSSEEPEEVEKIKEVEEEPVEAEEVEIVEEKFYTINLRDVWTSPRGRRTPKAIRVLKDYIRRHMKVEDFKISNEVNQMVWGRSLKKPPRRLIVRAVKDKDGNVIIFPAKST
ncbi:MAG: 50S ribosomal protein L31e [Candidatus Bathyarchaeia archaeon]|nr:60S ribosomal protein L31 [Candidatus Bathyarchaeota archaeon]